MINLNQGPWKKGDKLVNLKTKKVVKFETYYVEGLFKYQNDNQRDIIGRIERFRTKESIEEAEWLNR